MPDAEQPNALEAVNDLGLRYALAPDGEEKEGMLLDILKLFHGYVMKYVTMIIHGTLPPAGSPAARDSKLMLRTLIPRGQPATEDALQAATKMLHLAFKGQTTEDIYDTLAVCLMKAARRYDPLYSAKMREICEGIELLSGAFSQDELDLAKFITRTSPFDSTPFLRGLVRKGYLRSISGKKKVIGYAKTELWPPSQKFLDPGVIGFVYVVQIWFRYYLNHYIDGGRSWARIPSCICLRGTVSLARARRFSFPPASMHLVPCSQVGRMRSSRLPPVAPASTFPFPESAFACFGALLSRNAPGVNPCSTTGTPQGRILTDSPSLPSGVCGSG